MSRQISASRVIEDRVVAELPGLCQLSVRENVIPGENQNRDVNNTYKHRAFY
jgi:hypothetical protein